MNDNLERIQKEVKLQQYLRDLFMMADLNSIGPEGLVLMTLAQISWTRGNQSFTEMSVLQNHIVNWSEATFTDQPVQSKIRHMRKEIDELLRNPDDVEEWADLFILLLMCLHMQGITIHNWFEATWLKMAKNRDRKWNKPDHEGVIEHVRQTELSYEI